MRSSTVFEISDVSLFKHQLLFWAQEYREAIWLDSNGHHDAYSSFDALLAVEAVSCLETKSQGAFEALQTYRNSTSDWIFGYLSYDLKNDVETLVSENYDGLHFPDLYFFQPKKIIRIKGQQAHFLYITTFGHEIEADFKAITNSEPYSGITYPSNKKAIKVKLRIFKDEYFNRVNRLLAHIHRGDLYEANFCQEFYSEETKIDPLHTYFKLNDISSPPFAAFFKNKSNFMLSASPERYLKKTGTTVISQPIKGTARRSARPAEDSALKRSLEVDEKERSENIMIVDLVRNDLSKNAVIGSVQVAALCEVRTYKQVHQMISTVIAKIPENKDPVPIIKDSFPMGSMTGAPKIAAMKIIELLESSKRGLYSGAIGYFDPLGDFDFSVVIRSILYNDSRHYVSYSVGSAITAKSKPESEYQECLLKAKAMREVLEN